MKCDVHGVENCDSPSCRIWKDNIIPGIPDVHIGSTRHVLSGITGDLGYCSCGKENCQESKNHPPKDSTGKPVVEDGNY